MLAVVGHSAIAGQTYYRWLDKDGTPVNSDRPPPAGTKYEVVETQTNRAMRPETSGAESAQPGGSSSAGSESPGNAVAASTNEEQVVKDPDICEAARKNLDTLNTHARIRIPDGNGNYRYIDEEEKATQRANAQSLIDQHCE